MKRLEILFCLGLALAPTLRANDVVYPPAQSFSHFPYVLEKPLPPRSTSFDLRLDYANVFTPNFGRTIVCDLETFAATLSAHYGLARGLTGEVHLRFFTVHGGFLDGGIEWFHRAFSFPNANRPEFPRDQVYYRFKDYFTISDSRGYISPPVFALLKNVVSGERAFLSARLALGLPLMKRPGFVSENPFATAGLIAGYSAGRFALSGSVHVSWFRKPTWLQDEPFRPRMALVEAKLSIHRFRAGFAVRTSPFGSDEISRDAHLIWAGVQLRNGLELGFTEDFTPFDTTPDVGFYLKYPLRKLGSERK